MTEEQVPVTFIDNPHAPEVYVTGVSGLFLSAGNVVLTFESARVDDSATPGPVNRMVIARSVLTVQAAQALVVGLNVFLEHHNLSPSEAAKGGATAQ